MTFWSKIDLSRMYVLKELLFLRIPFPLNEIGLRISTKPTRYELKKYITMLDCTLVLFLGEGNSYLS